MTLLRSMLAWTLIAGAMGSVGCRQAVDYQFHGPADMRFYKEIATSIDYPEANTQRLSEVDATLSPRSLRDPGTEDYWDLNLEEALRIALENSKVMRDLGGRVLSAPNTVQSTYNPAVQESDPNFGVEGALSAFDAQFTTGMFWERNDRPRNVNAAFAGLFPVLFSQEVGRFNAGLSKQTATGGQFAINHNVLYDGNNSPTNLFASSYTLDTEVSMVHPLLQGAGVEFNRIAGPNASPGNYNGVVLARINNDIALTDFEGGVRNLVSDVENAYWDLYFAYRDLDAKIAGRDAALKTWQQIYALYRTSSKGGEADKEALAREQYFFFRAQVENALSGQNGQSTVTGVGGSTFRGAGGVYARENNLRFLMGLTANDGRLIRPNDEPLSARIEFDWEEVLNEALCRRLELRRQRWVVKRRELELLASKNFLMPRLDGVAKYRWVGFGDDLANGDAGTPVDNAYENMFDGDFQEWQLGVQLTLPVGFRQGMTGVRNAQLLLARERAILEDQELQVSHDISGAVREMHRAFQLVQTNFNRRAAAARQVDMVQAAYDANNVNLDVLLDAQRRLADSDTAYYRSLVEYNLSVKGIHFEKGSLLDYNAVQLAEGPWPGKAYRDASRRAARRRPEVGMDYTIYKPDVVSRGQYGAEHGPTVEGSTGEQFLWEEGIPAPPMEDGQMQPIPADPLPTPATPLPGPGTTTLKPAVPGQSGGFAWGDLQVEGPAASSHADRNVQNHAQTVQQAQFQAPAVEKAQVGGQQVGGAGEQQRGAQNPAAHRTAGGASGWKRAGR